MDTPAVHYAAWTDEQVRAMTKVAIAIEAAMNAVADHAPPSLYRDAVLGKLNEAFIDCEAAIRNGGNS